MKASLSFISDMSCPQDEKLYELWLPAEDIPLDFPWTNCQFSNSPSIEIKDVRSGGNDLDYDSAGFKFLSSPLPRYFSDSSDWRLDDSMVQKYIEDSVELIKKEFNAQKVLCFDWRVS